MKTPPRHNKWFASGSLEFHCGHMSTNDTERPRRPNEVTTEEMINKIKERVNKTHDIVLDDCRIKIRNSQDDKYFRGISNQKRNRA